MELADCFAFGRLGKVHGIKGEIKVHFVVQSLEPYLKIKQIYLAQRNALMPAHIEKLNITGEFEGILQLKDLSTREGAEALSGTLIYLPLTALPKLKKGQFYYHDIIGYTVMDEPLGRVGNIAEVLEMPAQDLLRVTRENAPEVLIPIHDAFVGDADHTARVLHTHLPAGLLEVYDDSSK